MFAYVMDLKTLADHHDAAHAITCLNKAVLLFDTIAGNFDVFKIEIKADASYMVVAGIHDQSYMFERQNESQIAEMPAIEEGEDDNDEKEEQDKNSFDVNSTEIIAATIT